MAKNVEVELERSDWSLAVRAISIAIETMSDVASIFSSHGESNKQIIKMMLEKEAENCIFFLDEPEQALDIDGLKMLLETIKKSKASQTIVITHHPFIILDSIFNVVEMSEGYYDKIIKFNYEICEMMSIRRI